MNETHARWYWWKGSATRSPRGARRPPRSRPRRRADLDRADRGSAGDRRFLDRFGPRGLTSGWRVSVMPERRATSPSLERAGLGSDSRARHGAAGVLRLRRRPRGRADPCAGRRVSGRVVDVERPRFVPLPPEATGVARTGDRGAASALHGSAASEDRYARLLVDALDLSRCRGRSTWCSHTSEFSRTCGRSEAHELAALDQDWAYCRGRMSTHAVVRKPPKAFHNSRRGARRESQRATAVAVPT